MSEKQEFWRTIRWIGLAIILVSGLYFIVLRPLERFVGGTSSRLEKSLDRVLSAITRSDTRIIEGRAEIIEKTEIAELSLLEMRMTATRAFQNEGYLLKYLPAGTKKIILRGHYQIKAGYRLKPGISLRVENDQPIARFPKAEILSVELTDFEILNEEDGWLNRITPEDRATVLRELREQMRQEAIRSGMLETVQSSLRTRLRDLLGVNSVTVLEEEP